MSVITDVVWTADSDGRFVKPQPAWSAYTGQTWEELRDLGWLKAIHEEDRQQVREAWERSREADMLFKTQGRLWNAGSQKYRHFEARATPVMNLEGIAREWAGSCTDVDERKSFENTLRKSEERLRFVAESMPAKIFTTGSNGDADYFNQQWVEFTGHLSEEIKNLEDGLASFIPKMSARLFGFGNIPLTLVTFFSSSIAFAALTAHIDGISAASVRCVRKKERFRCGLGRAPIFMRKKR